MDRVANLRTGPGDGHRRGADRPGFFWLVGQGGTGIQTAPAYGALVASQVLGSDLPADLSGIDPAVTSPARFR